MWYGEDKRWVIENTRDALTWEERRTETTEKRTLAHCLGWTLFKRDTVHMLMPV